MPRVIFVGALLVAVLLAIASCRDYLASPSAEGKATRSADRNAATSPGDDVQGTPPAVSDPLLGGRDKRGGNRVESQVRPGTILTDAVTFESLNLPPGTQINPPSGQSLTVDGFTFTPGPINVSGLNDSHYGNAVTFWGYNGTHVMGQHDDVVMTKAGGGTFSVVSFDFAGFPVGSEMPFTVTGQPGGVVAQFTPDGIVDGVDGKADFETFTLPPSFSNLTSVTWQHFGPGTNAGSFFLDNINLSTCPATNEPPEFVVPTPPCDSTFTVVVGTSLSFAVRASDADGDPVTLMVLGLPSGASTVPLLPSVGNPVQAVLTWTPTAADEGSHVVTFSAMDQPCEDEVQCRFTIDVVTNRPPDCSHATASVDELWPPNHQWVPIGILGVTDPDEDPVSITITAVSQDEPLDGLGDGDTCPDARLDRGELQLRAERSGRGDGRVYVVSFTADDGRGGTCQGTVSVCSPKSLGSSGTCGDDGQTVSSLGSCGGTGRVAGTMH